MWTAQGAERDIINLFALFIIFLSPQNQSISFIIKYTCYITLGRYLSNSIVYFIINFQQADLLPFLYRYPAVLGAEVRDIEPKVEYLFQTLGGSQEMLRRFPSFLSYDLEAHTRPRAEFLRALKIDPLINGLAFLVNAPAKEIAYTAGVRVELFNQFQTAYSDMCKRKSIIEKEKIKNILPLNGKDQNQKAQQISSWINQYSNPEESLLDEFDLRF